LEDAVSGAQIVQVTQSDDDVGTSETFSCALDASLDGCRPHSCDPRQLYMVDQAAGRAQLLMPVLCADSVRRGRRSARRARLQGQSSSSKQSKKASARAQSSWWSKCARRRAATARGASPRDAGTAPAPKRLLVAFTRRRVWDKIMWAASMRAAKGPSGRDRQAPSAAPAGAVGSARDRRGAGTRQPGAAPRPTGARPAAVSPARWRRRTPAPPPAAPAGAASTARRARAPPPSRGRRQRGWRCCTEPGRAAATPRGRGRPAPAWPQAAHRLPADSINATASAQPCVKHAAAIEVRVCWPTPMCTEPPGRPLADREHLRLHRHLSWDMGACHYWPIRHWVLQTF
jgi:hypothetical protein